MIRIFLIVFVYGGGLVLFAWWVDKIFATWFAHEWRKSQLTTHKPQPRIVFREDTGELVEKREPFCLSGPGQRAVRHNIRTQPPRAPGMDSKRVG